MILRCLKNLSGWAVIDPFFQDLTALFIPKDRDEHHKTWRQKDMDCLARGLIRVMIL